MKGVCCAPLNSAPVGKKAMIPNCIELGLTAGESCGIRASCDAQLFCRCDITFIRTGDFGSSDETDCLGQTTLLYLIYTLYLILVSVSAILYLSVVTRFSQFKRLIPFLLDLTGCAIAGFLKITDLENRPIGDDIAVTLFLSVVIPSAHISNYVIQNKYLSVQNKLVPLLAASYERQLKFKKFVLLGCTFLSCFGGILFVATLVVSKNDIKIVLFRVAYGILAFAAFGFTYALAAVGNGFQNDVKVHAGTRDKRLQDVVTRSRDVKNIGSIAFITLGLIYLSGAVSEKGLFFGAYTIPIQLIIMFLSTISVLIANTRKLEGRESPFIERLKRERSKSKSSAVNSRQSRLRSQGILIGNK